MTTETLLLIGLAVYMAGIGTGIAGVLLAVGFNWARWFDPKSRHLDTDWASLDDRQRSARQRFPTVDDMMKRDQYDPLR